MTSRQEDEWVDVEREAYLADADRRDAQDVLDVLVRSPLGRQGDGASLLLAAQAYQALRSARRREVDRLEKLL